MTVEKSILIRAMPFLFILSWASGFPVTRLGLEFTEPFTLLWVRSVLVLAVVVPFALIVRAPWPHWKEVAHIAVYLAADESDGMTGQTITISGGMRMA